MIQGIAGRKRRDVKVLAVHDIDGRVRPMAIKWDDGRRFTIDRVIEERHAASLKVGGRGIRYTCDIGTSRTYLFYEHPYWFVEEKIPEGMEEGLGGSEEGPTGIEIP